MTGNLITLHLPVMLAEADGETHRTRHLLARFSGTADPLAAGQELVLIAFRPLRTPTGRRAWLLANGLEVSVDRDLLAACQALDSEAVQGILTGDDLPDDPGGK